MFTGLYVMYRGNLSYTIFNIFVDSKFQNVRIFEFVRILVGFNRINYFVILLKDSRGLNVFLVKHFFWGGGGGRGGGVTGKKHSCNLGGGGVNF